MLKEQPKAKESLIFNRRNVVTVLVLLHFTVLLINNLPHTPFTLKVQNLYLWYMNLTGQYQTGWGMYGTVTRQNDHYQLKVYNSDNPDQEYRFYEIENARELYFVETIPTKIPVLQNYLSRAYLTYKQKDLNLEENEKIELHRNSATIVLKDQPNDIPTALPTLIWPLEPEQEVPKEGK